MLTAGEQVALALLGQARDALAALDADIDGASGRAVDRVNDAMLFVHARPGRRDAENATQADYLAEQVVLLTDVVDSAGDATATAKVLADGTTSVTVKVPPQEPAPVEEAPVEAVPVEEATP